MAKVMDNGNGTYSFYCPGCKHHHVYYVKNPHINGAQWTFNGDLDKPTFQPSLLNRWGKEAMPDWIEPNEQPGELPWSGRCHLFVVDGVINFCGDCTHPYSGKQGVPMEDITT